MAPIRRDADVAAVLRISDADRNGTLRRLHNAVALGLIDIDEFEERSARCRRARLHSDLAALVGDLPGPGAIVTTATDRVELRGVMGSLKRQGEWTVPTRLALVRRMGSIDLDLTRGALRGTDRGHRARHEVRLGGHPAARRRERVDRRRRGDRRQRPRPPQGRTRRGQAPRDPHRPKPVRVDRHPRAAARCAGCAAASGSSALRASAHPVGLLFAQALIAAPGPRTSASRARPGDPCPRRTRRPT